MARPPRLAHGHELGPNGGPNGGSHGGRGILSIIKMTERSDIHKYSIVNSPPLADPG